MRRGSTRFPKLAFCSGGGVAFERLHSTSDKPDADRIFNPVGTGRE
jgi:hypothetical protein